MFFVGNDSQHLERNNISRFFSPLLLLPNSYSPQPVTSKWFIKYRKKYSTLQKISCYSVDPIFSLPLYGNYANYYIDSFIAKLAKQNFSNKIIVQFVKVYKQIRKNTIFWGVVWAQLTNNESIMLLGEDS